MADTMPAINNISQQLLKLAKQAGCDQAEVFSNHATSLVYSQRLGAPEGIEQASKSAVALRVFWDQRQALVSTTMGAIDDLGTMVDQVVAMAKAAPRDPFCGLNDNPDDFQALGQICQTNAPSMDDLRHQASTLEDAARAVKGVTNSEGCQVEYKKTALTIETSNGLSVAYKTSEHGFGLSVLASRDGEMEREYAFRSAVYREDLGDLAAIGRQTGVEAVRRLGGKKITTATMPVVYHPRAANSFLRHLAEAINGSQIARGTSFLHQSRDKAVFAPEITIVDDPLRRRGLRSRPCDCEGVRGMKRSIIEDGILRHWFLDHATARQLKEVSTGHAQRKVTTLPSPASSNFYIAAGKTKADDLVKQVDDGFYATELLGLAFNLVTGDYSRGASGFRIEKGALTYPVSEVTIAGNLKDLFGQMEAGDDLQFRYGIDAPTLRFAAMTLAGK